MDDRKAFPKDYLASHDLDGKDVPLTIDHAEQSMIRGENGEEKKLVLFFTETRKDTGKPAKIVLNITNARTIAAMHGNEMDEWKGKRIALYPTTCNAFGDPNTDCIRIRAEVPE